MNRIVKKSRRGFSLVELLAVVLILAVLAAVAVPLYLNTRKTSAARACKGSITAIAAAESAKALRDGKYYPMAGLLTGPEGLASVPKCPLDGDAYVVGAAAGDATEIAAAGVATAVVINCPNGAQHVTDLGGAPTVIADYQKPMAAITAESGTP